ERMFLDAAEKRQHVVPGPADVAELAPDIVVASLTADVAHRVDRRRTSEHLAARNRQDAAVREGLGLAAIAPVHLLVADKGGDADRHVDPKTPIVAAGFNEQNADRGIAAQSVCEYASR